MASTIHDGVIEIALLYFWMTQSLIVNIDVPDLVAAVMFYEVGLGFRLRRKFFDNSVAEMESAGGRIFLIEKLAGSMAVPGTMVVRNYSGHWTPVHLDIVVDDLGAAVERVCAAGASASGSISSHVFGDIAPMRDPFGHGFCLIQFSETGYDAVVSR
jgi:predicted enzyme related to lactoylglutathione lyase